MLKPQIKEALIEQRQEFLKGDYGLERIELSFIEKTLTAPLSILISGLRRAGKSTFLRQIAHKYYKDSGFYYINFEDENFLGFEVKNFNQLFETLIELYGEHKVFFIDEVQNIPQWELFVRRLHDSGYKFYITGSNSEMLSRELGSRLTGRHLQINIFPFCFYEYLQFKTIATNNHAIMLTKDRARLNRALKDHLSEGGIALNINNKELGFASMLYQNILYRDIIARYRIESEISIKELIRYLASNISAPIAFNKLKQPLQIGNVSTIKRYIDHLEMAWLFFTINIFDPSVKRQQIAPKKIYAIDPSLINTFGFSLSNRDGAMLENFVFLELRRKHQEIYYYKTTSGYEVDFFVPDKLLLVQSCYDLSKEETIDREVRALNQAMDELKIQESYIVSMGEERTVKLDNGKQIHIVTATKWAISLYAYPQVF